MKRTIFRATVAAMAVLAPATATTLIAPAAQAQDASIGAELTAGTNNDDFRTLYENASSSMNWLDIIKRYQSRGYDNVKVVTAYSKAMDRLIPLVLIQPENKAERASAPTLYLLNGADGGEGRANWIAQTDIIDYYGGNLSKNTTGVKSPGIGANIVIPMAGAFSYYSDWTGDNAGLQGVNRKGETGGRQKWETFMTKELPAAFEKFKVDGTKVANSTKAIAGMSMSGTTSLAYAEHNPGMYAAVGSFSGCASTTSPHGAAFVNITLNRGNSSMEEMWGGPQSATARHNDALLGAEQLRGTKNIYVSNGSGLAGEHDMLNSPRVKGNVAASATVIVEGGAIEMATNGCTNELKMKTDTLGIGVNYNFRFTGTHQWGYWQDDTRYFWKDLVNGLGTGAHKPPASADPNFKEQGASLGS